MGGFFKKGDCAYSVPLKEKIEIRELLGSGGQGEVYRVTMSGETFALKWYFDQTATAIQRHCIETLIDQGPPSQSFLWPSSLACAENSSSFGYLMPLREKRFESFIGVVNGRLDPTFSVLMTVGLNLVECFHRLHAAGLCYRDISFGNGFFDPSNGDVLICDNDNVTANNASVESVLGTPDFMAPEIVMGKARPSRETDYFSLSILLFYLFHIQHPLLGKKVLAIRAWDLPAREKLFGHDPIFIFDPDDKSNEAVDDSVQDPLSEAGKNAIPYWNDIYPTILKRTFTTSFTDGIENPNARILGTQWKAVLSEARDSIFACPNCGKQNFFDSDESPKRCWNCSSPARPPFFLEIGNRKIPLTAGKRILEYHVRDEAFDSNSRLSAKVISHPNQAKILGLCNQTDATWAAKPQASSAIEVPPGKSVPLFDGTTITIGNMTGCIKD